MPVPFFGKEFAFVQPDGTTLRVRGWGDQEQAVFETLDGFTVVRDPVTGFYQYATVSDDGEDFLPTGFQAEDVGNPTGDPRVHRWRVNPYNLGLTPGLRTSRRGKGTPLSISSGLLRGKTRWETRREVTRMQLALP